MQSTRMRISFRRPTSFFFFTFSFVFGSVLAAPVTAKDLEIKVGIVQRFGDELTDQVILKGDSGGQLKIQFMGGDGNPQTLNTNQVTLEIVEQSLGTTRLNEHLVLSDHGTFETAEDSAKQWQAKGIAVEVTQPERWQVWANRKVYKTPLLRRLLLQSLKKQGNTLPYLNSEIIQEKPLVSFVVNGYRYSRQDFQIESSNNLIWVQEKSQPNRLYGGTLSIQANAYGNYTLVNQVPLEIYLRGVVPHEIGAGAPPSATEAQTIIARTYALRNLRRFQADDYELCADTHCQVYWGLTGASSTADAAIAATQGLVLTYGNELVDALYSSTTGGITAPFSDIWNGEERPYLKAVVDAPQKVWDISQQSLADEQTFRRFIAMTEGFNETGRSVFRWNSQSSLTELAEDLRRYLKRANRPLADFKTIQAMAITKRSPSGRILKLEVQTDKGVVELYKTEVRTAFGPPRSTLFYLEPIYGANQKLEGYAFIGGGFGHGVGMSQYGSYNLSKLGWSAKQILEFYYPGTTIQPLNDSIIFWSGK